MLQKCYIMTLIGDVTHATPETCLVDISFCISFASVVGQCQNHNSTIATVDLTKRGFELHRVEINPPKNQVLT